MSLEQNLREMEVARENYWRRYPKTSPIKLRWRALSVRHCFHVLPGESILELGAGSGLWTEHLTTVLRGENPITAAVFNEEFAASVAEKNLPNTEFIHVTNFEELPAESFDYIVGTAILCHLAALYRLLKPGGQLLFFEANYWNPQVFLKNTIRPIGRWSGDAECQIGMRKFQLMKQASHQGYTHTEIVPYDLVHPLTPRALISAVQSTAFILEHAPVIREFCGTLYIWLAKPGNSRRRNVNLATHPELFKSTSFVIPCHNEEMNIPRLIDGLIETYGDYIHEIVIVYESMLINYPFFKVLCNRAFHLLVNVTLLSDVRDVSNNLKLYRAEILKELEIEEPHFAANMETGLKPLLAGYDIKEVPISWINRTVDMGESSFKIFKVAPNYFWALMRTIWKAWRGRRKFKKPTDAEPQTIQSTKAAEELEEAFSDLNQLNVPPKTLEQTINR
jgi:SAM-dependent methyltransferase